ncbi:AHH domain-containing protein [Sphingomonadaceae bacterium]|nr:AHH domain-containing protein [Sphingomonadaceae bacterium]
MSLALRTVAPRKRLSFAAVNRRGTREYRPDMQRHHLLPKQLMNHSSLGRFIVAVDPASFGFEDFRRNGLLLPCEEETASRLSLPLNRGPHPEYNEMVSAKVGVIEVDWSVARYRRPKLAKTQARLRLALLQRDLRESLLASATAAPKLNRHCKLGAGIDFTQLDAMAQQLWDRSGEP